MLALPRVALHLLWGFNTQTPCCLPKRLWGFSHPWEEKQVIPVAGGYSRHWE